jgi:hypothetical protein
MGKIMTDIKYLIDKNGRAKAVVIPIEIWNKIMPNDTDNLETISESLEDYCLNKAMDEAKSTPLLDRATALKLLEEE